MTPIADMIERMLSAGTPVDIIVLAVRTVEQVKSANSSAGSPTDSAAEKRRTYDRERKRLTRHLRLTDSEWGALVGEIVRRDECCKYCGSKEKLTADHVVPMSRGGTHDPSNLVACCIPCNSKKGNKLLSEWLPDIHGTSAPECSAALKEDSKKERKRTGERIPPEWKPSPADLEFASSKGMPRVRIDRESEKFKNYWTAKSGAAATKLDWSATWRNWVLQSLERHPPPNGPGGSGGGDSWLEAIR